jgi:hypothetical protein
MLSDVTLNVIMLSVAMSLGSSSRRAVLAEVVIRLHLRAKISL